MKFSSGIRSQSSALLLSISLSAGLSYFLNPASAEESPGASVSSAVQAAPDIVPNFQRVCSGIWRGGAPSDQGLNALAHDGVKTVIDLRLDGTGIQKESAVAKHLGLKYFHFPLGFSKPSEATLRDILTVMTDSANQPVFIHCRQGADRTGMLVGIYRRLWQGWSFDQTWEEMRAHGFKPFLLTMKHEVASAQKEQMMSSTVDREERSLLVARPGGPVN